MSNEAITRYFLTVANRPAEARAIREESERRKAERKEAERMARIQYWKDAISAFIVLGGAIMLSAIAGGM